MEKLKTKSLDDIDIKALSKKEIAVKNKKIVYTIIKRAIDIFGGLVGVILLVPIMTVVWIMRIINKENNGPMFYGQLRIGRDGKYFRLYKFRSMCINADEKLKKYLAENEEARKEFEENFKLKDDPRITKTGAFLRKTSLDEWPQFLNLLRRLNEFSRASTNIKRGT